MNRIKFSKTDFINNYFEKGLSDYIYLINKSYDENNFLLEDREGRKIVKLFVDKEMPVYIKQSLKIKLKEVGFSLLKEYLYEELRPLSESEKFSTSLDISDEETDLEEENDIEEEKAIKQILELLILE